MQEGELKALRVLLIEEDDGWWSAQCLEHDIAAQARKMSELPYEFQRVLMAHVQLASAASVDPLSNIDRAPQKFWDMYEEADWGVSALAEERAESEETTVTLPPQRFRVADQHFP